MLIFLDILFFKIYQLIKIKKQIKHKGGKTMKGKTFLMATMIVIFLFASLASQALAWDLNVFESQAQKLDKEISKALALREMDMNQQAAVKLWHIHKSLSKLLEEDPNNLEALFVLAKCEYYQGNWPGAEKKFKILYLKNRQFGKKIFAFYQQQSQRLKRIGQLREAVDLAVKSFSFKPNKKEKEKMAEEFFRAGSRHLFAGDISAANKYYQAAFKLSPAYMPAITQAYLTAVEQNIPPKRKIILLGVLSRLICRQQRISEAKKLNLTLKKIIEKIANQIRERQIPYKEVKREIRYLPKKYRVRLIKIAWPPKPPEYKIYSPGTYYFNLGPGEITEPGIEIPVDKLYKYFLSSDDYQYVIIYDDGKEYKGGNYSIPHRYRARFKLRALKKERIKLVITEER